MTSIFASRMSMPRWGFDAHPITVHRGRSSAVLPVPAGTTVGAFLQEVAAVMRQPVAEYALRDDDGTLLVDQNEMPLVDRVYLVRKDGEQYEAPQRPFMPTAASCGAASPTSGSALTQRLPPSLAQFVMEHRPSPVTL
jgi:hypothetical protein